MIGRQMLSVFFLGSHLAVPRSESTLWGKHSCSLLQAGQATEHSSCGQACCPLMSSAQASMSGSSHAQGANLAKGASISVHMPTD